MKSLLLAFLLLTACATDGSAIYTNVNECVAFMKQPGTELIALFWIKGKQCTGQTADKTNYGKY